MFSRPRLHLQKSVFSLFHSSCRLNLFQECPGIYSVCLFACLPIYAYSLNICNPFVLMAFLKDVSAYKLQNPAKG